MGKAEQAIVARHAQLQTLRLMVEITQYHIDAGTQNSCSDCAGALAIGHAAIAAGRRAHPVWGVNLMEDWVRLQCLDGSRWGGMPPPELQEWTERFDNLGPLAVEPASFVLELRGL